MTVGQMLVALGYKEEPARSGFPSPAIIAGRDQDTATDPAYGVETKDEVEAYIDVQKTVAERATTKRSPGNWS